jgi:hypothetical protein
MNPLPINRAELIAGWAELERDAQARKRNEAWAEMMESRARRLWEEATPAERARMTADLPRSSARSKPAPDLLVGIAWGIGATAALGLSLCALWYLVVAWEALDRQAAGYVAFSAACVLWGAGRLARGGKN